eukprot:6199248-Ditylum_brightwellii.AAC.1
MFDDDTSRPAFTNVGFSGTKCEPVIDVSDEPFAPKKTAYEVVFRIPYGTKGKREHMAENL